MFGFVKSDAQKPRLGGDIFQLRQRRKKISFAILGVIAFAILNIILYSLTIM